MLQGMEVAMGAKQGRSARRSASQRPRANSAIDRRDDTHEGKTPRVLTSTRSEPKLLCMKPRPVVKSS